MHDEAKAAYVCLGGVVHRPRGMTHGQPIRTRDAVVWWCSVSGCTKGLAVGYGNAGRACLHRGPVSVFPLLIG